MTFAAVRGRSNTRPATGSLGHRTALQQDKCRTKCAGDGAVTSAPAITKSTEKSTFTIFIHNKLNLSVDCSSSRC